MRSAIDTALPPPLPLDDAGAVLTVGTFDGVHLGHREVLRQIVERAARGRRRSVLVTFFPHPLRIVRPEIAPPLLTTAQEKKELLSESGLEYAVFLPFTRTLQGYPARRFVEEILLGRFGMRELVIGYDHGFGRDREGSVETLRELGSQLGFAVDVVEEVRGDAAPVSSTRIRRALAAGEVEEAARGLGRRYELRGPVVRGERLGRKLGYPTANVRVLDPEKMLPLEGVYAVFGWAHGQRVPGLLHLGPRPTFQGLPPSVELHLLDWSGDLYGAEVRVEFVRRLRGIEAFRDAGELVERMRGDEAAGREIFAALRR